MIKDLIVHLDGTKEDEIRLAQAEAIATSFTARILGLYANPLPDYALAMPIEAGATSISTIVELERRAREEGEAAIARLTERFGRLSVPGEVRRLEAQIDPLTQLCVSHARCADLFVATTPYRADGVPTWDFLIEAVLFEGGHSVYVVPPGKSPTAIKNVLIAWRDTREAARAVDQALPFLSAATRTRIVTVATSPEETSEYGKAITAHLQRHGVSVEFDLVETEGSTVGAALLTEAHTMQADLIVMGAYGHSRFREWILGGVTRELIERSDLPILLAH